MKRTRVTLSCKECKNNFEAKSCLKDKAKFCSLICKGEYQKKGSLGKANPNYRGGKSVCIDCSKILTSRYGFLGRESTRCKGCYKKHAIGINATNWKGGKGFPQCVNCKGKTGDVSSIFCRNCYRGALRPQWKGGVSSLQSRIRTMPEYRSWMRQCMYRDGYECRDCGEVGDGKNLQVHHIEQFAVIVKENNIKSLEEASACEKLWDMDNGKTLCIPCHKLTDSFNKKLQ